MIKIANFDSVLEIAFGLNALFFLFELVPHTEEKIRRLVEEHERVYKEKVEATGSTEAFPVGFVISATYPYKRRIMEKVTIIMSMILLALMIYASFVPNAEMSSRKMTILLCFSYGIPCLAIRICKGPIWWLQAGIADLERLTSEARNAKSKKEMEDWRNLNQEKQ